jgi:hypothetical protein
MGMSLTICYSLKVIKSVVFVNKIFISHNTAIDSTTVQLY